MRNADYENLFRELASQHLLIRHRDEAPRFARVVVPIDPMQKQLDLYEMHNVLLGRDLDADAGQHVLVLESLQTSYQDNGGDNYQHQRRGAFFVFEKVENKADAWAALDRTEQTGEELLGAVLQQYADQPKIKVRWPVGSIQSDAVGPVGSSGNWWGTRFDFEFFTSANSALRFNPAAFKS